MRPLLIFFVVGLYLSYSSGQDEGPFGSFWHNQAHFEFIANCSFPTPSEAGTGTGNVGTYMVIVGETWYLFHREVHYALTPPSCIRGIPYFRIVVRASTNKGLSWTEPGIVAEPIPDNLYANCAMVDGAPFFEPESETWHYLSQSFGVVGGWSMSHFSLKGTSPFGNWTANPANPVVYGGQLFNSICDGVGKHCQVGMVDEGTPDIVMYQKGFYYVTFHGYDYVRNKAARGVGKTDNFIDWITLADDLPGDVIFSHIDCQQWNISWHDGTCVGSGEGSILISGDYFYQLIEATDVSLACSGANQYWVLGLVRSTSLTSVSGEWEQAAVSPIIVPQFEYGCALQYHRLFTDGTDIYLSYWYYDNSDPNAIIAQMQIFQLVDGEGIQPIIATNPPNSQ